MAGFNRFNPPPYGPYDSFQVVSALRKTIKLGELEDAIYWANVMVENDALKRLAKNLWIMAAEDIDDPDVVIRAFVVYCMVNKVPESDHVFFLVRAMVDASKNPDGYVVPVDQMLVHLAASMTRARKWWEHREGVEVDKLWSKAIGDYKVKARRKPVPEVALDQHTRAGKALARKTGHMRDELSGTDKGRLKTLWQFLANGVLHRDVRVFDSEPGFRKLYEEQQAAQGNRRPFPAPEHDPVPEPDLFAHPACEDDPDDPAGAPELPMAEPPRFSWNGDPWTGPHGKWGRNA